MSTIDAHPRTVRELLANRKYSIEFYQREYKWQKENIEELLEDLITRFTGSYNPKDSRMDGIKYDHYFLGSIIVNERDGERYLIDGQQRLTSLTLLLIHLDHLQHERPGHIEELPTLIRSTNRGIKAYNINVEDRTSVMDSISKGETFDPTGQPESTRNISARYEDIQKAFPDWLADGNGPLLFFIDWLLDNVNLVEIVATSEDDAYMIFETMNDRGMSLTPVEMLKGYLLSNIDEHRRERTTTLWRERIELLVPPGRDGKEEDANFFKSWLRAKYAKTIRANKQGAENEDFDKIGTAFNKWVYDNSKEIGLVSAEDFQDFLENLFVRYSGYYLTIRNAARTLTPSLEYVYYNAYCSFTLQSMLILATIRPDDDEDIVGRKMRLVSGFIDIYVARQIWNYRNYDFNRIHYSMFNLAKEIRDVHLDELAIVLRQRVEAMNDAPFGQSWFGRNKTNSWRIRYMLARITQYVEEQMGRRSTFTDYVDAKAIKPYEIEHIWADDFDSHVDEFNDPTKFSEFRNLLGDLLLLPRGTNQSLGDKTYEAKVDHYCKENSLAASLSETFYQNNPNFTNYVRESTLPFQPYSHFKKANIIERQELYQRIAEEIWSPARFDRELT